MLGGVKEQNSSRFSAWRARGNGGRGEAVVSKMKTMVTMTKKITVNVHSKPGFVRNPSYQISVKADHNSLLNVATVTSH